MHILFLHLSASLKMPNIDSKNNHTFIESLFFISLMNSWSPYLLKKFQKLWQPCLFSKATKLHVRVAVLFYYTISYTYNMHYVSISSTPKKSDCPPSTVPYLTPTETWSFDDNSKTVTAEVSSYPEWRPSDLVSNFSTPLTLKLVLTSSLWASIL